jgi:purine-binding chemotaxis protein CheW
MAPPRQLCTFLLGRQLFGVDVTKVQEVFRWQEMTRVPLAPRDVRGLINLRGQIVTAIETRRRLGLPDREAGALPTNVLVRTDDGVVSLLVDEIGDVVEVDEGSFEPPPATMAQASRDLVRGVYKLEGALLLLLDTDRAAGVSAGPAGGPEAP